MALADDDVVSYLRACTLTRAEIDRFVDPDFPKWATFDPTLGYLPHPCVIPDGADGSLSKYSYEEDGARRVVNCRGDPCRISSFGNSFTQGVQVSDGQTWQELLSAHFREPIRNFGVGGYGVYQAIRRLQNIELTSQGRSHLLLNIYYPDHQRSIDTYRLARLGQAWRQHDLASRTSMFHGNPWEHVRLDPSGSRLQVCGNVCPTVTDLYQLCNAEFVIETFRRDLVIQLVVAIINNSDEIPSDVPGLADTFGLPKPTDTDKGTTEWLRSFYDFYAQQVSLLLIHRLVAELDQYGRKLLVLLSYPSESVVEACRDHRRPDTMIVEGLRAMEVPFVDGLSAHVEDFAAFSLSPTRYVERYFNGHFTPAGNQFFALTVQDSIRRWIDPAPPAYRNSGRSPSGEDVTAIR